MEGLQGVNIAAPVLPYTTGDVYPTHHARYGKGGYRTVADIAERDSIMPQRLEMYMLVCTQSDGKLYRLTSLTLPLSPSNWEELEHEISYSEHPFENVAMIQIEHNRNRYVTVNILNTNGNPIEGDVRHINKNFVQIGFSENMTGTVIIT